MKKIIPLIGLLLLVQLATAQVNFGARMGVNMGTFEFTNDNFPEGNYDINQSFNVLINLDVDVPFSTVFSFRTGLGFVVKGAEFDNIPTMPNIRDSIYSAVFSMNYLEVPLFLVARAETDFFGTFFLGVGPTLSLGVGGRMELFSEPRTGRGQDQTRYDIIWGNRAAPETAIHGYNYLRRFDFGLGAVFSYQLPRRGLTFTVSYNRGLRNLSPNEGMNLNTSYLGFSIGFLMGR